MAVNWSKEVQPVPGRMDEFPDDDGVYVIAQVVNIDLVRYVGQGNIRDRMTQHQDYYNEPNQCLRNVMRNTHNVKVCYAIIPNRKERNDVEYTLYAAYLYYGHQLCNKIEPAGDPIHRMRVPFSVD